MCIVTCSIIGKIKELTDERMIYMISNELFTMLNSQLNFELSSIHVYIAMQAYCESQDLKGFSNFFKVQTEEERFHAMRFFNYINQMNGRVTLEAIQTPKNDFQDILNVFKDALAHEKIVTSRIYALMDKSMEEREHATISFLKWFIDEQVEEEETFSSIIKRLERINDDSAAIYMLDQELSQRTFVPPTTTV